jgi:hypothetical protein
MKIALLIPDGVGIRNYLYSDIVPNLMGAGHEVIVWHHLDKEVIATAEALHNLQIPTQVFEPYADGFRVRLLREATTFARLHINAKLKDNPTILTNWSNKRNTIGRKLLYPLAERLGSTMKTFNKVEKWEAYLFDLVKKSKHYRRFLEELQSMRPDVLFCTHQRVPYALAPMLAAQTLGIKTAVAIFSWDNLPKARLVMRADHYFVWSDYMKQELQEYYPNILPQQIAVTGTPQFDFYKKQELIISREDFASRYGLDVNKKWVLFSGDDVKTSPYDSHYFKDVAEELSKDSNIQLLFRQVPSENEDRYLHVLKEYSNTFHVKPEWVQGATWSSFFPKFDDVILLVNLAKHCELVINIGSTMALDFAHFKKPALFINYDLPDFKNWSIKTIYNYQHFRSMKGLHAVGWINSNDSIYDTTQMAILKPLEIAKDSLIWLSRIQKETPSASKEIVRELVMINN